jgi:hypothetical protein
MSSKLTVIIYILLSFMAGIVLTLLPWVGTRGLPDWWGENFFLLWAASKLGYPAIQKIVASGWVRGAVTGLGLLNIFMAIWQIPHFHETVRELDGELSAPKIKDVL